MDELNIEEFKLLVSHYNKRATDAELKNAELQLLLSRLRNVIKSYDLEKEVLESEKEALGSEIVRLSERVKELSEIVKESSVKKTTSKVVKVKE